MPIIKGKLTYSDGQIVRVALPVKAYHSYLDATGALKEKLLIAGNSTTLGEYSLTYTAEANGTHLFVRVFATNGTTVLLTTPTYYKAAASLDVNLALPAGAALGITEVAALRAAIVPFAGANNLANFPEKELRFLAAASELPYDRLRMLSFADRYAVPTTGPTGDMLYGIYRGGLPLVIRDWLGKKASAWTKALNDAVSANIIGTYTASMLPAVADRVAKDIMAGPIDQAGKLLTTRLHKGPVLATAFTVADCEKVLANYLRFEDSDDAFWASSAMSTAIGATLFASACFAVQVGNLVLGYTPLIARLCSQRKAGTIADVKALAAWDSAKWVTEITAAQAASPTTPFPAAVTGANLSAQISSLAALITSQLEAALPVAKLIALLNTAAYSSLFPQRTDMLTFFRATVNANYDLYKTNLATHLTANPTAMAGVNDIPKLKEEITRLQRQFRMGPAGFELRSVLLLRNMNLHASFSVAFTGPEKMEKKAKTLGLTGLGTAVYNNAMGNVGKFEAVRNKVQISALEPAVIQAVNWRDQIDTTWKTRIASMPELFGSLDSCECAHCRSLYGPAAYFADVAHFLQRCDADPANTLTAWDVLLERRPDLEHILLNCENASTEMPYIDLVIELLEHEVAKVSNLITIPENLAWLQRQTTKKTAELDVVPENQLTKVWDELPKRVFPWRQPFSLWDAEGDAWLRFTGKSRSDLRDLLASTTEFSGLDETSETDHLARLGMLPVEAAAITLVAIAGAAAVPTLKDAWGLASTTSLGVLIGLPMFLRQSGLKFAELQDLLKSPWINPGGTIKVSDDCAIASATLNITASSTAFLQRFHAFARLRARLGWTSNELDWALEAFGYTSANPSHIDKAFLWRLALVQRLQASTGLRVEEAVAMLGQIPDLDLRDQTSLYTRLFTDHNEGGELIPLAFPAGSTIGSSLAALARVFQLSEDEVLDIVGVRKFTDMVLSANSLAFFYRFVQLFRLLKVSPSQVAEMDVWNATGPFSHTDPVRNPHLVLVALERMRQLLDSGWKREAMRDFLQAYVAPVAGQSYTFAGNFAPTLAAVRAGEGSLEDLLARNYGFSAPVALELANGLVLPGAGGLPRDLRMAFVTEDGLTPAEKATLLDLQSKAAFLLDRLAILQSGFALSAPEMARFIGVRLVGSVRSYTYLPWVWGTMASKTADPSDFLRVQFAWLQFRPHIKTAGVLVFDLMDKVADAAYWSAHTVFGKQIGSALTPFAGLFNVAYSPKLIEALSWMSAWNMSLTEVGTWQGGFSNATMLALRAKLRKAMGPDTWQAEGKKLRNVLRTAQVDALCDYLYGKAVTDPTAGQPLLVNYGDRAALYEYLLVDPAMSTCMRSSRIRLAHSTVQLFAQRCLMNIEAKVKVQEQDAPTWKTWSWRKNYRVWEANRKVFLYPENWVEPELRDDKTDLFKAFEVQLMQHEGDLENIDRAVQDFVNALKLMSNLRILSISENPANKMDRVLFLQNPDSQVIFFIQHDAYLRRWGPWRKATFAIKSAHFTSFFLNGVLHVAWLNISPIEQYDSAGVVTKTRLEIQASYSKIVNGQWLPAKSTDVKILTPALATGLASQGWGVNEYKKSIVFSARDYVSASGLGNDTVALDVMGVNMKSNTTNSMFGSASTGPDLISSFELFGSFIIAADGTDPIVGNQNLWVREEDWMRATPAVPDFIETGVEVRARMPYDNAYRYKPGGPMPIGEFGEAALIPSEYRMLSQELFNLKSYPSFLLQTGGQVFYGEYYGTRSSLTYMIHPAERLLGNKPFPATGKALFAVQDAADTLATTLKPVLQYVRGNFPHDRVNFDLGHPHGPFNWELFFHLPFTVAKHLSRNQKFAEAQKWFHYIFDPTDTSVDLGAKRYWNFKPFRDLYENAGGGIPLPLANLEVLLFGDSEAEREELATQVAAWEDDPFNPHLLARLRPAVYMRSIVMHYIQNLLDWADQLFAQDTMESINEATQLYILAQQMLGPRPQRLPKRSSNDTSLRTLLTQADALTNAWLTLEDNLVPRRSTGSQQASYFNNMLPAAAGALPVPGLPDLPVPRPGGNALPNLQLVKSQLYFCTPDNDRLLDSWNQVADRLWKIRNCRDISGQLRNLALYEPEIDPGLLVRAKAMGVAVGDVMSVLTADPFSHYRFAFLLQKALEYTQELKSLGNALLAALEKRDAEQLQTLRLQQEHGMQRLVRDIRLLQVEEANKSVESLSSALEAAEARLKYYQGLKKISSGEVSALNLSRNAQVLTEYVSSYELVTSLLYLIPEVQAGAFPSVIFGGANRGNSSGAYADSLRMIASSYAYQSSMATTMASYERRWDEWKQQERQTRIEVEGLQKQLIGAEIRVAIAERELRNLDQQLAYTQEQLAYLESRFSSVSLYNWMAESLGRLYFDAYKMTFDLAKSAEKRYYEELGIPPASGRDAIVQYGHWNNLRKGLLAGEGLGIDLRRLETAYMTANTRRMEISRAVSLGQYFPEALVQLREQRVCRFRIPAGLFAKDFPTLGVRRVKSVSLTIPAVTGPYGQVNALLQLLTPGAASRTIAVSHAQNDAGLFQLNFNDERLLPFEGASLDADTDWELRLPGEQPAFHYREISDVVLTLQYTAKPDVNPAPPAPVPATVLNATALPLPGYSMRLDFPELWLEFQRSNVLHLSENLKAWMPQQLLLAGKQVKAVTAIAIAHGSAPAAARLALTTTTAYAPVNLVATATAKVYQGKVTATSSVSPDSVIQVRVDQTTGSLWHDIVLVFDMV